MNEPAERLVFEVHPKPTHRDYGTVDGAFASCWLLPLPGDEPEQLCREALEQGGWEVEELDGRYLVSEQACPPGAEGREFFDQVQTDRLVIVFYRWPVGAPEDPDDDG